MEEKTKIKSVHNSLVDIVLKCLRLSYAIKCSASAEGAFREIYADEKISDNLLYQMEAYCSGVIHGIAFSQESK